MQVQRLGGLKSPLRTSTVRFVIREASVVIRGKELLQQFLLSGKSEYFEVPEMQCKQFVFNSFGGSFVAGELSITAAGTTTMIEC
jgi:hypothetical protein